MGVARQRARQRLDDRQGDMTGLTALSDDLTNEDRLTRIQALVVELLNDMLRAPVDQTDAAIDRAMARIGAFCQRDRAYVFLRRGELIDNTHEWCAPGIEPMREHLQSVPISILDTFRDELFNGAASHVPDVRDYPSGSTIRVFLEEQGIRSLLLVPMHSDGAFFGFLGFDAVECAGAFLPGEIYLLQSLADVITSVLIRRETTQAVARAQDELRRERAFLAGILSTSAAAIVVFSAEGKVVYANDASEQIVGAPVASLIDRPYDNPRWRVSWLDGAPIESGQHAFEQVQRSGRTVENMRIALYCEDGIRYASINAAPVPRSGDGPNPVVYAITDVTELVQAELAREAALDEARRANVAKSHFLARMSHEIRTPLNGVLGIAQVLSTAVRDPAHKRMIDILHDSGNLLMSIINDLLDMSKIEADALELETVPFSLQALAERTEAVHTLRASEKQLSFGVRTEGDCERLRMGDPHRLLQVLHNIIGNALKFTDHGMVCITICAPDPDMPDAPVVFEVRDTGIGMSDDEVARMFEEFAQADGTIARRFGGTGLGMSIVQRLVAMMQGSIDVQSTPGEGTTIRISLPLPPAYGTVKAIGATDGSVKADLCGLKVLAVDDNRTNRMILAAMLGQLGIETTLAEDGPSALAAYGTGGFDAVILDISMPGMDGVSLLQALRGIESRNGHAPTPAIAFTANAMAHQVSGYMAAGFDACVTKPLRIEQLRDALDAVRRPLAPPVAMAPLRKASG